MRRLLLVLVLVIVAAVAAILWLIFGKNRDAPMPLRELSAGKKALSPDRPPSGASSRSSSPFAPRPPSPASLALVGVTPSKAAELLEKARQIKNANERSEACYEIMRALCLAGYSEEAWNMIDPRTGQSRNAELGGFFENTPMSVKEAADKISGLAFQDEIYNSLRTFSMYFDTEKLQALLADPDFKNLIESTKSKNPAELEQLVRGNLQCLAGAALDQKERTKALQLTSDLHQSGLLDDDSFATVLKDEKDLGVFEKWDLISRSINPESSSEDIDGLRQKVIDGMIVADAGVALEKLAADQSDRGTMNLVIALNKYSNIDPEQASEWFGRNQASLTQDQADGAAMAFFRTSLANRENGSAETWARQIHDVEMRAKLLDMIGIKDDAPR